MECITSVKEMQAYSNRVRDKGKTIALVPTMGYFHPGHLSLMEEGRRRAEVLVTSIFVNPTQFGIGEDYEQYPRDWERDQRLARDAGVDVVFAPTVSPGLPDICDSGGGDETSLWCLPPHPL